MRSHREDLQSLLKFVIIYHSRKTKKIGIRVERFKNVSVNVLMHRRGRFQRHVWHTSMIGLAAVGVLTSGVMGGGSIVQSSFPGTKDQDPRLVQTIDPFSSGLSLDSLVDMHTKESERQRSEVLMHEVKSGETLSELSQKYDISIDTIKWANDLDSVNSLKPGQSLRILPVTGVEYKVKSGDTLASVAKKYSVDQQAVVSWPWNDIADDFKLKPGQVLIIPDGQPEDKPVAPKAKPQPQYIAQGPTSPVFEAPSGGGFVWPTQSSGISQYFAWYHPGIDMPNSSAPPVVASDGGVVVVAGWKDGFGYGNRVMIDHGNGYQTLYAHLSNIYVGEGQRVSRGQVLGKMGSTGRSTGIHLHFELRYKGRALNPLAILK
jgi:murein DD-endopeptidase MepM/ murein hydrolase activator NlpD